MKRPPATVELHLLRERISVRVDLPSGARRVGDLSAEERSTIAAMRSDPEAAFSILAFAQGRAAASMRFQSAGGAHAITPDERRLPAPVHEALALARQEPQEGVPR